jgi:hypothetical protein
MRSLVPALLCLASAAPLPPESELTEPPAVVHLHVRAGRAGLIVGEEVRWLRAGADAPRIGGPAYLELPVGASVELVARGRWSALVEGPAAFEWDAPAEVSALRVADAGRMSLEVRRGELHLALPGGWHVEAGRGAQTVEERGTRLSLSCQAGAPLRVTRAVSERPPRTVAPGRTLVLPRSLARDAAR